jgi:hypothetical protein
MNDLTATEFVLRNKDNSTRSLSCLLSSLIKLYLSQFLCKLHAEKSVCLLFSCACIQIKRDTCMRAAVVQYSGCCQAHSPRKFTLHLFSMSTGTSFHVVKAYDTIPHCVHVPRCQQFTFPGAHIDCFQGH